MEKNKKKFVAKVNTDILLGIILGVIGGAFTTYLGMLIQDTKVTLFYAIIVSIIDILWWISITKENHKRFLKLVK